MTITPQGWFRKHTTHATEKKETTVWVLSKSLPVNSYAYMCKVCFSNAPLCFCGFAVSPHACRHGLHAYVTVCVYPSTRSNEVSEYLRLCGWQVGAVCVGLCDEQSQVGVGLFEVKLWNPDEWVCVVSCGKTWTSPQQIRPTPVTLKPRWFFLVAGCFKGKAEDPGSGRREASYCFLWFPVQAA